MQHWITGFIKDVDAKWCLINLLPKLNPEFMAAPIAAFILIQIFILYLFRQHAFLKYFAERTIHVSHLYEKI